MKIRTNYVSNSSSSSFLIIGKEITNDVELDKFFENNDKVLVWIIGAGLSGDCEDWIAFLNRKQFNKLKKTKWFERQEQVYLYDVQKNGMFEFDASNGNYNFFDKDKNKIDFFEVWRDYSSPDTDEEFNDFIKKIKKIT